MNKPLVSVIIYNPNGRIFIESCLSSVFSQTYSLIEIIVVDADSNDGSTEIIKKSFPQVKLIKTDPNCGFARGNNLGIRAASGDYLLCLNLDVILAPNYVEEIIATFEEEPKTGSATGKLLLRWKSVHNLLDTTGHLLSIFRKVINRGAREIDRGQYDKEEQRHNIFGVCAAAAIYRRKALEDVTLQEEYFDESFHAYFEDADLDWRLKLRGWQAAYVPSANAFHERGGMGLESNPKTEILALRNRWLSMVKNESFSNLLVQSPFLLLQLFDDLFNRLIPHPYLWQAVTGFLKLLPQTLKKRRMIQNQRRLGAKDSLKFFTISLIDISSVVGFYTAMALIIALIYLLGIITFFILIFILVALNLLVNNILTWFLIGRKK